MSALQFDCIIVGSGHAGSCAALSAIESGCKKGSFNDRQMPPAWAGGNGYFTAGAHRTVHAGLDDLLSIVNNVSPDMVARIDMDPYTRDDFIGDIMRLGSGKSDTALVNAVVDNSRSAIEWLARVARVPFMFSFNRQAYEVDGRQRFWGGMVLSVQDGGKGLIAAHQAALAAAGVTLWFNTSCQEILLDEDTITGLVVRRDGVDLKVQSPAVILAAGGFEANPAMRAQHLGPGWEKAKVRGTPYNTGEVILLAKAIGARLAGDWQGCHSTAWDANAADDRGDKVMTNQYTKSGYTLGVMVNARGERFVDEGEDFRNYTYAKFGRAILLQPGGYAFQIWDNKVIHALRKEEYSEEVVKRIMADSIDDLAKKLSPLGLEDVESFMKTMTEFNSATVAFRVEHPDRKWNPAVKDGLSIDPDTAGVINDATGRSIRGLFCTGEMVGGLFYSNYPGGSGLTAGAAAKLRVLST
ncbi:FAD/NAD(P)-binding domain-containing protein [Mucidula mucida]|nr:FAD/NAD(P)-binding domain-containing protein [Mucidula mucida]